MNEKDPKLYCYMIRKGKPCVKLMVQKKHLPYYECEKCIWRIKSEEKRHLNALKILFEKYGNNTWE